MVPLILVQQIENISRTTSSRKRVRWVEELLRDKALPIKPKIDINAARLLSISCLFEFFTSFRSRYLIKANIKSPITWFFQHLLESTSWNLITYYPSSCWRSLPLFMQDPVPMGYIIAELSFSILVHHLSCETCKSWKVLITVSCFNIRFSLSITVSLGSITYTKINIFPDL